MSNIAMLGDNFPFDENGHPIIRGADTKAIMRRIEWLTQKIQIDDHPGYLEAERTALFRISRAVEILKRENKELRERLKALENA